MRMTRGVRLLGVALLVLLLGGVDELGIGSGRFGCGGVMAQMNRDGEKEDEKSGLPPSDGAEKQAPKEEEEEKPQTDTRSSLSNRDLSAENQQLRADNAQLTETNQVLVAKDEEYKKRVVELKLEVERLRADCAERPSPDAGKQELPPREEHADLAEKLTQYMEDLTASRHREELLQAQVTSLTAIAVEREKQNLTPEQERQLAMYVPLTTANSALQKRVDELVAENTVRKTALEALQEAHDDLVALHDTDRGRCRALGAEKQTAEEELDTLQSQKTSLAQQLTACEAAKDALQQVYDDLLKQTDQQQARIAALEAAVSQNSKEVLAALSTDELVSANTVCESEKADLSSEITKVRDEMKQLRATHETTVSELAEAKQELSMLQSNKTLLESEKSNCEAAKDALQQAHDDLLKQTDQQQARIAALEAAVSQNSKEALIASSEANVIIPGIETAALQPPCSKEVELAAKKRIASMVHAIQVMTNDERHNVIRKHDETGRLQQELRDLDASYALALQKVQRRKRSEMITGIVLGLVFPLLALLGVLLYLYWQRRRSDVLSSADAAATSSLMDQETELVNRRTGSRPDEDHNGLRNSLTETRGGGAFEDICL